MKKLILSFGLLFCFSACLLAGSVEVSDFNALQSASTPKEPEIEFEVSNYLYRELIQKTPQGPDEQFMKLTGVKYGVSKENINREHLRDPFFTGTQIRFMVGLLDYDGGLYVDEDNGDSTSITSIPYKNKGRLSLYLDARELIYYPIQVLDTTLSCIPFLG
ncbi:hypothetical protein AGMMS49936_02740 [Endomicrobiia bacterium]|nr:hypothetical protein AGMMS49936_02740 [Endomicrobiia bacterium]